MTNHIIKAKYHLLTPWLLLLVFVIPWIAAQVIYAKRDHLTFKTIETGKFLSPPIQAQSLPFYNAAWLGIWQIIYIKTENTDIHHITRLLNQLHRALGKEKHRAAYQIISINNMAKPYTSLLAPGEIAIIDPRGWLIMHYPPDANPIHISKDIRRLLRYSHGK